MKDKSHLALTYEQFRSRRMNESQLNNIYTCTLNVMNIKTNGKSHILHC